MFPREKQQPVKPGRKKPLKTVKTFFKYPAFFPYFSNRRELLRVLKKGSNPQEEKSDLHEEKKNPQEEKTNLQEEKAHRRGLAGGTVTVY